MWSLILSAAGWVVKTILPTFLAKKWGRASAKADALEAANAAQKESRAKYQHIMDMSDDDFYEFLQPGGAGNSDIPALDAGGKAGASSGNEGGQK